MRQRAALGLLLFTVAAHSVYAAPSIDAAAFRRAAVAGDRNGVRKAARALLRVGDEAVPLLEPLLGDADRRVREATAAFLIRIGSDAAIQAVVDDSVMHIADPIHGMMGLGEGWRRLLVLGPRAIPFVVSGYRPDRADNDKLVDVIIAMKSPAGKPLFMAALADVSTAPRQLAAYGLGAGPCPGSLPVLVSLLEAPEPSVGLGAIMGLAYRGDSAAIEPLVRSLEARDSAADFLVDNPPPRGGKPMTLHRAASDAIDSLSRREFHGDIG